MRNFKELQKLVYGYKGLVLTKGIKSNTNIVSQEEVCSFIVTLNEMGYTIKNVRELFKVSKDTFSLLKEDLFTTFEGMKVNGVLFRKSFAKKEELVDFKNKDFKAMFAQYSLTYGWSNDYETIYGVSAQKILDKYFSKSKNDLLVSLKTKTKEIIIGLDLNNDIKTIVKDLLSSKSVLREEQLLVLSNIDTTILEKVYLKDLKGDITIKETEILLVKLLIQSGKEVNYKIFNDMDQIVRTIYSLYSYEKGTKNLYVEGINLSTKMNKSILKEVYVNIPTKMKKVFTKAINDTNNIERSLENMYKYFDFWKTIFNALKWESIDKTMVKYPTFMELKERLYLNDRSNTLNSKVENAKYEGNYDKAIRELSTNPGSLLRNLMEYLRYSKGELKATKSKEVSTQVYTDYNDRKIENVINISNYFKKEEEKVGYKKKSPTKRGEYSQKITKDTSNFLKSEDFIEVLSKTNTKLLWQMIALLDDERNYETKTRRYINSTKKDVTYVRPLPGIKKGLTKIVEKQVLKAIKKIKKEENKQLGKVCIKEDISNYKVEFSGRESDSLSLSGEYLTPGSKISFNDIKGEGKILRLGIAWRGKSSCDIDHSLNIFNTTKSQRTNSRNYYNEENSETVYYGNPTYEVNKDVVITSSGDIVSNGDKLFSTELIDIDLDKAKKYGLGNMFSSATQFSGMTMDNYEVLWFMNIIDKKDRVLNTRRIEIKLDQMDYAIQVTKSCKKMLGFYIDLQNEFLEVLNIANNNEDNYSNAMTNEKEFLKLISERPNLLDMREALVNSIKKNQVVSEEEAQIIICSKLPEVIDETKTYLRPGKDGEKIQEIIF